MVIYAIGIKPRDELAQDCGIECHSKGGIVVGDDLRTSAPDVYAIGECANWKGNYYGLIAPGSMLQVSMLPPIIHFCFS
jgi:nitrite reductase (NAD(P)H)